MSDIILKIRILLVISLVNITNTLSAQSPLVTRGDQAYHTYDRMEILGLNDSLLIKQTGLFTRKEIVNFCLPIWVNENLTNKDRYDLDHIFGDNIEFLLNNDSLVSTTIISSIDSEFKSVEEIIFETKGNPTIAKYTRKPLLNYFFKTKANFLEIDVPSFRLFVNPVVQFGLWNQKNNSNTIFTNIRGLDIRGYIDEKVYFYTQLLETQRNYFNYIEDRIDKYGAIPGQGFYKNYTSSIIGGINGYDFFYARAYIGFQATKNINVEFGHGNHFIGNGIRSLLLSDYSHNYLYLRLDTKIWKFQYQNIFAELAPTSTLLHQGDRVLPKKYMATHFLSYQPNSKFEVGLFETVIFARPDHFEFQYLNPVILYRAVEHFLDSPDNVILGFNIKYNLLKKVSIYGQLILDEFKLSEIKKQTGWWANKYGTQIGLKYINAFGIDHLDLQAELNVVRPFTYTHRDTLPGNPENSIANYSHQNQPLAHLLGANFREFVGLCRYKPTNRLYVQGKVLITNYGEDPVGQNYGSNILLPHETRTLDYGNKIGQGILHKIRAVYIDASYEFYHNFNLDIQAMYRTSTVSGIQSDQHYLGGGIRINIANIGYDY